jgi:peptidoglycan/LPS O-acetylase OafA/YrhL
MLLGVLYHAVLFGGMPGGGMEPEHGGPAAALLSWLHSFRMPLFFIISGFFCAMMLGKHGLREYLKRRWTRIGAPLLLGVFTIVPLYHAIRGMGGAGSIEGGGVVLEVALVGVPVEARAKSLSEKYLGVYGQLMRLDYLWFLWYLLIFATVVPLTGAVLRRIVPAQRRQAFGQKGEKLVRSIALPAALGAIAGPLLMMTPGTTGWSLGHAAGIFERVPEFVVHLERDMPFYLAFFIAGWVLYRHRAGLPELAQRWLINLIMGIAIYALATRLSDRYAMERDLPHYGLARLGGCLLYAAGSAFTAFGFLGWFQMHLDRPNRLGRYLAETAFWVYMVHQPILAAILRPLSAWRLPWWAQGILASGCTATIALALYELLVRPTLLARLFGPGQGQRRSAPRG